MNSVNDALFIWLNAPAHPGAWTVSLAAFLASDLIWAVPLLMVAAWLRGGNHTRKAMVVAATAGLLGLLLNQCIGLVYWHPRPFMVPIGHTLISHAPDSSFPSDHLTLWWAVALSLWSQKYFRLGAVLSLAGLPIAWARIYLGVHFPLDMAGAAIVAIASAWLSLHAATWYLTPVYLLALRIYRKLCAPLIAQGWIHR
ncbi:undecaprenyl-diphosphatase [Castellaniella sp.]|uniref:undecaprenyl-diphosphatase n=1 Tax=Castellaniella sp. TaxID=1955812 RepID=UPI003C7359B3